MKKIQHHLLIIHGICFYNKWYYSKKNVWKRSNSNKLSGVVRARKGITLVISKEDMDDIISIIKSLENLGVLIDRVWKTVKDETKEQESGFLGMLWGTLGASILGNILTGKSVMRAGKGFAPFAARAGRQYKR